jgi:hypothetical protein
MGVQWTWLFATKSLYLYRAGNMIWGFGCFWRKDLLFMAHLHSLSLSPETIRIMLSSLLFPPPPAVVVETSRAVPVAWRRVNQKPSGGRKVEQKSGTAVSDLVNDFESTLPHTWHKSDRSRQQKSWKSFRAVRAQREEK